MTDRELLELAAKAAGLKIATWGEPNDYSHRDGEVAYVRDEERCWYEWNPLIDDGDALVLAVDCGIDVKLPGAVCQAATQDARFCCSESYGDDPYAATRRAIVRAAAEIGRGME